MNDTDTFRDKRQQLRSPATDVLRWKRPGRIEDHRAWSVDRSEDGLGFCTPTDSSPRVGEVIHLRLFDRDRWMTVDRAVRVARTTATPGGELVFVGCAMEVVPTTPAAPSEPRHYLSW